MTLGSLASPALGGSGRGNGRGDGCDTSCPPGSTVENDGCGPGPDANGGCTQEPPAFQFVPSDLAICGTVGGWEAPDGTPGRDSDWFVFVVSEPSIVTITVHQENGLLGTPSPKFVVALLDSPNCAAQNYLSYVVGGTCPIETTPVIVQPGEYVFLVTVDAFGTSDPESACPVSYVARIGIDELYPSCTGSTETCLNSHATPGCGDADCCSSVCANPAFAYCCTSNWDAYCAAEAAMKEECAGDGCPRARVKSSIARFLVSRSRGKMSQPTPDLLEIHLQMSTAISLTLAAKSQLPQPDSDAGCNGINITTLSGKLDKCVALDEFASEKVQYLIEHPNLPPEEVLVISDVIRHTLDGAVLLYDLVLQQLSPCPADLTGDGTVDGADLAVFLGNWGQSGIGDFDESGTIDGADLAVLLGAWGGCPST
ncbi:MAG: hypothetical protein JNL80_08760 [Phycisphaerae bacterium]|nr:hypothetical protein [Phycisphaerae bacterium]